MKKDDKKDDKKEDKKDDKKGGFFNKLKVGPLKNTL